VLARAEGHRWLQQFLRVGRRVGRARVPSGCEYAARTGDRASSRLDRLIPIAGRDGFTMSRRSSRSSLSGKGSPRFEKVESSVLGIVREHELLQECLRAGHTRRDLQATCGGKRGIAQEVWRGRLGEIPIDTRISGSAADAGGSCSPVEPGLREPPGAVRTSPTKDGDQQVASKVLSDAEGARRASPSSRG